MKPLRSALLALVAMALTVCLASCATTTTPSTKADLTQFPVADMSEYEGLDPLSTVDTTTLFYDVTVADVAQLMDDGKTFVLFCSYSTCPWCNALIEPLSEVASSTGWQIAYINTRKDPSWTSNLDIDDYDEFVARFGEWLREDDEGRPHLYVPTTFFIREGKVVYCWNGVLEEYKDPSVPLTDEQLVELYAGLEEQFTTL